MATEPENENQVKKTESNQQETNNNENLAMQIPTVTPDTDNLEPGPDDEEDK
jgi:hypothetical protein